VDAKAVEQRLERAPIAVVGELALKHVEAKLPRRRAIRARIDELEASVAVDEPPDQPRAGDPVDKDSGAGHPGAAAVRFSVRPTGRVSPPRPSVYRERERSRWQRLRRSAA